MNLKELLNTESILLVGDSYGSLGETAFSIYLLKEMLHSALDNVAAFMCDGKMRGLAFKTDFWTLVTDIAHQDSEFESCAATLFDQVSCNNRQTYVVGVAEFNQSVITLLSDSLASGDACECAGGSRSYVLAYSPERQERIQLLFKTKVEPAFNLTAATILELGCGNGMATAALRELGYNIYAFDSDKCAVCEGLLHGALQKEKTLVLDGRYLSRYDF
ncbi:MAG: class I SAM-dependent methyltransferase, partial [Euryarchaeota archaeon]|nr:class I SAM-dependent methyltransferase [Euryarchaeota archaeon]